MKFSFSLSLAVLAVLASQAMAIIPIPVKECTKTVIVKPADTNCATFAAAHGCSFSDLLKWNQKLRPDCLNLDVGHPICVSVTHKKKKQKKHIPRSNSPLYRLSE